MTRFVAALLALALPAVALAQGGGTGAVTGVVTDSQGGLIVRASVTLVNEATGAKTPAVQTNESGVYVVPVVSPGTYTIEASMTGFKTMRRPGVIVSAGARVTVAPLVLAIEKTTEFVDVHATPPAIQAESGERSSVVEGAQLEQLPIFSHTFLQFVSVQPGVNATTLGAGGQEGRLGGGGQDNVLIDGVSVMDTGNNGLMGGLNLPVEAIAEVKVTQSGGAADVGRSSGLQITAVTKSGSNTFHLSLYDYDRSSGLNSNSWANAQNGRAKPVSHQGDFGVVLSGPVGRPGGANKLFFSYTQELRPRLAGHNVNELRLPTALERAGDFSATRDNNGALFNTIYDSASGLPKSACSATSHVGCFQSDGVLGRIPTSRLYGPGLALLNQYPLPNVDQPSGQSFDTEVVTPLQFQLGYTPALRLDYQASSSLRVSGRVVGATARVLPAIGALPGFDDTLQKFPLSLSASGTVTYTMRTATVLEITYGVNQNRLGAPPVGAATNRNSVACPADLAATVPQCALGDIAYLFPNAGAVDPRYYEYAALSDVGAPFFQNGRILLPPQIGWAASGTSSRISGAPPSLNYPGFMNINRIQNFAASLTRVAGRHTLKAGVQIEHSYKAQNFNSPQTSQGTINFGPDTTNPIDAGFPFANAALGIFSSFAQQSQFVEGHFLYNNVDAFLQDTWRARRTLTVDYGVRFVHQQPQYDAFGQTSNFFPDRWNSSTAPLLYVPGCAVTNPCAGDDRQAVDPRTGVLVGPGTSGLIGQAIPGTGDSLNGIVQAGHGIAATGYVWPSLGVAPRLGLAYDARGKRKFVLRGSVGLYFDRPDGNSVFGTIANPPTATGSTAQWGTLAGLGAEPGAFGAVPTLRAYAYDSPLPADVQWNAGIQTALPWSSSIDVSYVGHHAYHVLGGQQAGGAVDINAIDLGTTVSSAGQDPTQAAGTPLPNNLLRAYRGYSNILVQSGQFSRTYHSIQTSVSRRFRKSVSAGLAWTWTLSDRGTTGFPGPQLRLDHDADGTFHVRADQAIANALFGDQGTTTHVLSANFVWALPDASFRQPVLRHLNGLLSDWQISGIFRADSGAPYDVSYSYTSGGGASLTGSPDYAARVVVTGNPGTGCSDNQYRQFNTAAFSGPLPGSTGLESGRFLLHGCKDHHLDLSLQHDVRIGRRTLQLRMDIYNIFNTIIFTGRQTLLQLTSPADQTVLDAEYRSDGTVDSGRLTPSNAGFGAATAAAGTRSFQMKLGLKW